jgi:hypothetical protein
MAIPTKTLTPAQIVSFLQAENAILRVKTFRDVIPGGYMVAMLPFVVDWPTLSLDSENPSVVIRNVNYGGNPFERVTILHTLRVPLDGVEFAEFILVPLSTRGQPRPGHHAQLRFVFREDRPAELLSLAGADRGGVSSVEDLLLSWEAWHKPEESIDLSRALDGKSMALTFRGFVGPQRFLEDALHGQKWMSYRLTLPGGPAGIRELLQVSLALGDGMARDIIGRQLESGEKEWLAQAPPGTEEWNKLKSDWETVRTLEQERAQRTPEAADAPTGLPDGERHYQALLRSCATMARYIVLLTARRLIERGHRDGVNLDALPDPSLGEQEPWMTKAAASDLRGLFLRAPAAVRFVHRHPEAVPANIPGELAKAGLIETRDGKPRRIDYSHQGKRPYTAAGVNRGP